ncbi:hypothetical protein HAZT_HAZT005986 [Hyalella azteca]|uniref:Uncharacterized protein n=1 Tax=Hyalella azteca TaxID=294128 RepID=A0A6A0H318_HYAAZ|nr:hypothetical protein HAZT_HAZT005986 [Hyalella azteca]
MNFIVLYMGTLLDSTLVYFTRLYFLTCQRSTARPGALVQSIITAPDRGARLKANRVSKSWRRGGGGDMCGGGGGVGGGGGGGDGGGGGGVGGVGGVGCGWWLLLPAGGCCW